MLRSSFIEILKSKRNFLIFFFRLSWKRLKVLREIWKHLENILLGYLSCCPLFVSVELAASIYIRKRRCHLSLACLGSDKLYELLSQTTPSILYQGMWTLSMGRGPGASVLHAFWKPSPCDIKMFALINYPRNISNKKLQQDRNCVSTLK